MGSDNKLLEDLNGMPVLHHVMNAIQDGETMQTIVVLGYEAERIKGSLAGYETKMIYNDQYKSGIGSSIKTGIEALGASYDGVLIVLGDMPGITADILDTLIRNFCPAERAEICVPTCDDQPGNPVLWSNRFFPELCKLEGDVGGRKLIDKYSKFVVYCPVNSEVVHQDVDTRDQLDSMKNLMKGGLKARSLSQPVVRFEE